MSQTPALHLSACQKEQLLPDGSRGAPRQLEEAGAIPYPRPTREQTLGSTAASHMQQLTSSQSPTIPIVNPRVSRRWVQQQCNVRCPVIRLCLMLLACNSLPRKPTRLKPVLQPRFHLWPERGARSGDTEDDSCRRHPQRWLGQLPRFRLKSIVVPCQRRMSCGQGQHRDRA